MAENPLQLLMNPKSIAVAGANNTPTKMGTIQALSVLKDGYQGKFYPVHPTEKTILGITAYASPQDLPEVPDLALLIVPIKAVVSLLEDFRQNRHEKGNRRHRRFQGNGRRRPGYGK